MKNKTFYLQCTMFFVVLLFQCCAPKPKTPRNSETVETIEIKEQLISINIIDRNGITETVSSKERLNLYQKMDFLTSQPYQKVLRVYAKNKEGVTRSFVTSYYENGELRQYLEIVNGRAHGVYLEKHTNGRKKLYANVIAGLPDIDEKAQDSWSFDGIATAWDEEGKVITKIPYEKGLLNGISLYYYPDGKLARSVDYVKGNIEGEIKVFLPNGEIMEKATFLEGMQDGESVTYWTSQQIAAKEIYQKGYLKEAEYFDQNGIKLSQISSGKGKRIRFDDEGPVEIQDYNNGVLEGEVIVLLKDKVVHSTYQIKNGLKHGEEVHYYPVQTAEDKPKPKLLLSWYEGKVHGICKTWYENGTQESQREMSQNRKQGLLSAWYIDGTLMLIEEYDKDRLLRGEYLKKNESRPATYVINGKGDATFFDRDGFYVRSVKYYDGKPLPEEGV